MTPALRSSLAVAGVLAAVAAPAVAGPRGPLRETYAVTNPAPYPASLAQGNGCQEGPEGASKNTKPFTIPKTGGVLTVKLTGYVGDWDLILQKDTGAMIAESSADDTGNTGGASETLTYKKGKAGQKVGIVACNWAGGPTASVEVSFK